MDYSLRHEHDISFVDHVKLIFYKIIALTVNKKIKLTNVMVMLVIFIDVVVSRRIKIKHTNTSFLYCSTKYQKSKENYMKSLNFTKETYIILI